MSDRDNIYYQDRYYPTIKEEIMDIFSVYHVAFQNLFTSKKELQVEIVPFMYVIADIATINANKDRNFTSNIFKKWYRKSLIISNQIDDIFNERVNFYAEFVRGKQPRYEWLFFEKPQIEENGIFRCCAAFGDIIFNPECLENYDNAPVIINGIDNNLIFAKQMNSFIGTVAEFYNTLYKKICSISEADIKDFSEVKKDANIKINFREFTHYNSERAMRELLLNKIKKDAEDAEKKKERITLIIIACFLALFLLFGIIINQ